MRRRLEFEESLKLIVSSRKFQSAVGGFAGCRRVQWAWKILPRWGAGHAAPVHDRDWLSGRSFQVFCDFARG